MKIKLNVDRTAYRSKDAAKAYMGTIKKRVGEGATEIEAGELKQIIESGQSFAPALLNGTEAKNWISQQVIIADIDNDEPERDKKGNKVLDENGKNRKVPVKFQLSSSYAAEVSKAHGITPYLMYHTFSNGKVVDGVSMEKYRIVVVLDQPITDGAEANQITARYTEIFNKAARGSADVSIKNLDRVLYGSYKGSVFNDTGAITPLEVMRALPEIQPEKKTPAPRQEPKRDALGWDDPIEEPTSIYDGIKEQRRIDIDSFDLLDYILRTVTPPPQEKKIGKTTYLNPCPICGHNDDFAINVDGNRWHCFGAGGDVGGSIIDFIMLYENVTLQEALQKFDAMMKYEDPKPKHTQTDDEIYFGKKTVKQDPEDGNTTPASEPIQHFSKAHQLTMLGNWLKGNHREDIPLFGKALFAFKNLYKEVIAGGKTFTQIMAEDNNSGVTLTEIAAAVESDNAALAEAKYQEAKAEALLLQREKLIEAMAKPGADIQTITQYLLRVQAAIDQREVKPAAADLSERFLEYLNQDAKAKKLKFGRGFEKLDKKCGAMKAGQLVVLAARPAVGKSAAALQIAYNIAKGGSKVAFFPLEMTTIEMLERLILQQEIIESPEALRAPREDEKAKIEAFLDDLEVAGNLLFYEGVNQLEAIAQTIKEQRPEFVVIDQLTQVRTARRTKDIRERYVEVTADLKHLAIEYQTTILLLTQLNRASTDQSAPTLENLHESDATGQNADIVLLMQKKEPDESRPEDTRLDRIDIHIVKNRGGQSGIRVTEKFAGNKYRFYQEGY